MRQVTRWDHLEVFGIVPLTGEACGYNMRILCDLTAQGKALVEAFLGGNVAVKEGSNWNQGVVPDHHVGSVLLPYEILPQLAAFCMLERPSELDVVGVAFCPSGVAEYGDDSYRPRTEREHRTVKRAGTQGEGARNTHAFTGRRT